MPALSPTRTAAPLSLLAAVVIAILPGTATAGAVPAEQTQRSLKIPVAGLNLANPADVQRLDSTIRAAARKVCSPENYRDLRAVSDRPACEATAINRAQAKRDMLVARAQAEQLATSAQAVPSTN
jgi:UrcA family protein